MANRPQARSELEYNAVLRSFAAELINNSGNATLALTTVAPKLAPNPRVAASRAYHMRRHPIVLEILAQSRDRSERALQRALDRYEIGADHVAAEMVRLANTELRQVCDWGETVDNAGKATPWLRVRPAAEIDPDAHRALVSIKRKADGSLEVQLADKRAALMDLARLKGYIQDKPENAGTAVQLIIQR